MQSLTLPDINSPAELLRSLSRPPHHVDYAAYQLSLTAYDLNPLARMLMRTFEPYLSAELIEGMMRLLGVGTSRKFGGSTVFWQLDRRGLPRTGKIMAYDPQSGKRIKSPRALMTWVHALPGMTEAGYRLRQCFFGEHLAALYPERDVWLFESEKAALITHLFLRGCDIGGVVCMATGGCGGFNPTQRALTDPDDSHTLLRSRRVVLFPDEGKADEWEQKSRSLQPFTRELKIVALSQSHPAPCTGGLLRPRPGDGFDDILLRSLPDARHRISMSRALHRLTR